MYTKADASVDRGTRRTTVTDDQGEDSTVSAFFDSPRWRNGPLRAIVVLMLFAVLIAGWSWIFPALFGTNYLQWYLKNASPVFLGFAFVSLVWNGFDAEGRGLISADPTSFAYAYFKLCTGVFVSAAAILSGALSGGVTPRLIGLVFDSLVTALWAFWLIVALLAWFLIIGPLQYLLHLVTGAPARVMVASGARATYRHDEGTTTMTVEDMPRPVPAPEGTTLFGLFSKPVTLTTTIDAVVLWFIAWLLR